MNLEFQELHRQSETAEAVGAWKCLVSGRYCIATRFDQAGKRYLVAKPSANGASTPLTRRQRLVLARRARGAALKEIAFELGVSIGTVSNDLSVAMRRIGLSSAADLAAVFGHVAD